MNVVKRLWNTEATAGNAFMAGITALAAAWAVHDFTNHWGLAWLAGIVWSAIFLGWDVHYGRRQRAKKDAAAASARPTDSN